MRWQVQGTDADTGQYVELALDQPEAAQAIQLAMQRRIVVERIARGRRPWGRIIGAAAMGAAVLAGAGCAIFWTQNAQMKGELRQAIAEQTRLAVAVAQAENVAAELRDHGSLAKGDQEQVRKLAEDLSQARLRTSLTEQELSAAQKRSDELEAAAGRLPGLEKQVAELQGKLKDGEQQATDLHTEITLQKRRMDQEQALGAEAPAPVRITALEQANRDLSSQNDKMKQELLDATARLEMLSKQAAATQDAEPAATAPAGTSAGRWALRTTFDAANAFVLMRVNRDTVSTAAAGEGMMATGGAIPENAATLRFVHDRARERVYEVALAVSFAADAPREKLAENAKLAGDFLNAFAPGVKGDVVGSVTGQLAGKDGSERRVFLADDARVTVWNDGAGVFTFRVDSSHREAE